MRDREERCRRWGQWAGRLAVQEHCGREQAHDAVDKACSTWGLEVDGDSLVKGHFISVMTDAC